MSKNNHLQYVSEPTKFSIYTGSTPHLELCPENGQTAMV